MTATKTKKPITVMPFGVEADHPRNADLLLQSIPNCRLRGKLMASRTVVVVDELGDEIEMISPDQAAGLGQFPPVPGMQLHIDTKNGKVVITDPLRDDERMCDKLARALYAKNLLQKNRKINGMPTRTEVVDDHRMKTLIREVLQLVEAGHMKVVKGAQPEMEDVDEMPGRYLLNPGARVQNMQPRFEDQWDEWYAGLQKSGG